LLLKSQAEQRTSSGSLKLKLLSEEQATNPFLSQGTGHCARGKLRFSLTKIAYTLLLMAVAFKNIFVLEVFSPLGPLPL